MTILDFPNITFKQVNSSPNTQNYLYITVLKIFETNISISKLDKIGKWTAKTNHIEFKDISEKKARNKFIPLLNQSLQGLKNTATNNNTTYINQDSDIPLVGCIYFGITDRGTNIIELKPITGCNLDCKFCSINEGSSKKVVDFVIEKDYLVEETIKLIDYKLQHHSSENH